MSKDQYIHIRLSSQEKDTLTRIIEYRNKRDDNIEWDISKMVREWIRLYSGHWLKDK